MVSPLARDDSRAEGAGRVEGTSGHGGAEHDVDEDGETNGEGGETTNGLGISGNTGSGEDGEDEDEGHDNLHEEALSNGHVVGASGGNTSNNAGVGGALSEEGGAPSDRLADWEELRRGRGDDEGRTLEGEEGEDEGRSDHSTEELGADVADGLEEGHLHGDEDGNGDSGIEVTTRDVGGAVHHRTDGETSGETNGHNGATISSTIAASGGGGDTSDHEDEEEDAKKLHEVGTPGVERILEGTDGPPLLNIEFFGLLLGVVGGGATGGDHELTGGLALAGGNGVGSLGFTISSGGGGDLQGRGEGLLLLLL